MFIKKESKLIASNYFHIPLSTYRISPIIHSIDMCDYSSWNLFKMAEG